MSGPLYDRRWRQRRADQLRGHPLCRLCMDMRGEVRPATVADHVTPHRNDPVLFEGELQSLCAECHNSWKQAIENGGHIKGCDLKGMPIDPNHAWNKAQR